MSEKKASKIEVWLVLALVVAGVVQVSYLMLRDTSGPAMASTALPEVAVGDVVREISGISMTGDTLTLRLDETEGAGTAVLAFHSQCGWCERAAPEWRRWLESDHDFAVWALSLDDPATAGAYAASHDWGVRTLSVSHLGRSAVEYTLAGNTPWIWIFDSEGELVFQANGGDLTGITANELGL